MEMNLNQLALVAFFVEALIQTIKPIYDKNNGWNKHRIIALVIGVGLCVLTGVDLFTLVGLEIGVPYLGAVLTGIIASRGSNVTHDIFKFFENLGQGKPTSPVG